MIVVIGCLPYCRLTVVKAEASLPHVRLQAGLQTDGLVEIADGSADVAAPEPVHSLGAGMFFVFFCSEKQNGHHKNKAGSSPEKACGDTDTGGGSGEPPGIERAVETTCIRLGKKMAAGWILVVWMDI